MKFIANDSDFFAKLSVPSDADVEVIQYEVARDQWTNKSIVVADKLDSLALVLSIIQGPAKHLIQVNAPLIENDIQISAELVSDPAGYFENGAAALIKKPVAKKTIEFSSPDQKEDLRRQVAEFIKDAPGAGIAESTEAIVEEMYMNAMYDAPKEAITLRMADKSYANGDVAVMQLVRDEKYLAISCLDPFGSFNPDKCFARMAEVYKRGIGGSILFRDGMGAGIGIVLMFEHSSQMFFGVIPGQRTMVCATIPLGMSNRQRAMVKKGLHQISI